MNLDNPQSICPWDNEPCPDPLECGTSSCIVYGDSHSPNSTSLICARCGTLYSPEENPSSAPYCADCAGMWDIPRCVDHDPDFDDEGNP